MRGAGPAAGRVVLGNYGLIKGVLVAGGLWLAAATALFIVLSVQEPAEPAPDVSLFGLWLYLMALFGGLSLLVGFPVGVVLGLLLRPVRRQWIHVAAFFALPAAVLWAVFGFDPFGGAAAASIGIAAAVGRLSVCRNVLISPPVPAAGSSSVGP